MDLLSVFVWCIVGYFACLFALALLGHLLVALGQRLDKQQEEDD